jgi:hypothetical protein
MYSLKLSEKPASLVKTYGGFPITISKKPVF